MKKDFFGMKNQDKSVSRQTFEEIDDLVKYVKTAPINDIFLKERKLDSDQAEGSRFNDFDSFDDAVKGLEFGTDLYFNTFKKRIKKVEDFISKREKLKNANYKNDIVGFTPIVPNAIIGNPINMINQNIKPKPYPTAKIVIEKTNSAGINSDDMCSFYAIIFCLVQLLEKKNVRCELWVTTDFLHNDEIVCCKVKIKNYTQPLNMYKIQFPIIASDFLRRIMFRILETNPDITSNGWPDGYGVPLMVDYNFNTINNDLKEVIGLEDTDIFVPSCQWFHHTEDVEIGEAVEKIIKETNFKKYIKLEELKGEKDGQKI